MKKLILLLLLSLIFELGIAQTGKDLNLDILKGEWILDMSPEDSLDENFAKMIINSTDNNVISGYFYRDGVQIRNGRINMQTMRIYGALISGDGTGEYYTSFYLEEGVLYGSTHAKERDFLSVWEGRKAK